MTREQEIALLYAMYREAPQPPRDWIDTAGPMELREQVRWFSHHVEYLQERLRERGRELSWWRCCAFVAAALLIVVVWARLA